jgi:hypothetical protein
LDSARLQLGDNLHPKRVNLHCRTPKCQAPL